jgi:RNA polymerase sigma-70 factor (ECF subfamily)
MTSSTAPSLLHIDDDTLAICAATDFEAFAELYRRFLPSIYRFVRSQTPDDATAEDLTAQVFFNALSSAGSFRADGSYRSWLYRIAHNIIVSSRARREKAVTVENLPDEKDPAPSPASHAITKDALTEVWKKVAELPAAQREVVALRYAEDLTTEEIAEVTQRSRGAVRILLHRARARLRDLLQGKELL